MNMKQAAAAVAAKQPFKANFYFAEQGFVYVVYSYGYHYPMFIYNGQWYENDGRCSATTERHKRSLRPVSDTIKVSTAAMKQLLRECL